MIGCKVVFIESIHTISLRQGNSFKAYALNILHTVTDFIIIIIIIIIIVVVTVVVANITTTIIYVTSIIIIIIKIVIDIATFVINIASILSVSSIGSKNDIVVTLKVINTLVVASLLLEQLVVVVCYENYLVRTGSLVPHD